MPPNPSPTLLESHDDRIVRVEEKVEVLREKQATQTVLLDTVSEDVKHVQETLDKKIVPALESSAAKQRDAFDAFDRRLKVLEDHHVSTMATRGKVRTAVWGVLAAALGAIGTAFGGDFAKWLRAWMG